MKLDESTVVIKDYDDTKLTDLLIYLMTKSQRGEVMIIPDKCSKEEVTDKEHDETTKEESMSFKTYLREYSYDEKSYVVQLDGNAIGMYRASSLSQAIAIMESNISKTVIMGDIKTDNADGQIIVNITNYHLV